MMTKNSGHNVDTGSHMVRHLLKVEKAEKGDIVVGGLITPLALHYGYSIDGLAQAGGSTRIDVDSCLAMRMIVRQRDRYALCICDFPTLTILLPSPRSSVQDTTNWKYSPTVEEQRMGDDDDIEPVDDAFLDSPDHPDPVKQPVLSMPPTDSYAAIHASIFALHSKQQSQRQLLDSMHLMLQQMYSWHISQGHFEPPPPPSQ